MSDTLRVGIAGCGKVAELIAAAAGQSRLGELVAAASRTPAKAEAFAERHGIAAYSSIEQMVQESPVDAVIVCTPHPAHAAPTVEALKAGAHVLVEKPMAASLDDCDLMMATADETGRLLGVISQRRFYAPAMRIRNAIDEGRLGKPILGSAIMYGWRDQNYYDSDPWRGSWAGEGGGVLVNQAPHPLDLLLWYMGDVEELFGYWDNFNHPTIEVDDTAVAVLRFKSGALGHIVVTNSQNPALYARNMIHGDNGATVGVQTDGGQMFVAGMSEIVEAPVNDVWTIAGEARNLPGWQREDRALFEQTNAMEHYHCMQIEDFLGAVIDEREPLVTAAAGRKTVELFTAIYRCQQRHQPVRFPL